MIYDKLFVLCNPNEQCMPTFIRIIISTHYLFDTIVAFDSYRTTQLTIQLDNDVMNKNAYQIYIRNEMEKIISSQKSNGFLLRNRMVFFVILFFS